MSVRRVAVPQWPTITMPIPTETVSTQPAYKRDEM